MQYLKNGQVYRLSCFVGIISFIFQLKTITNDYFYDTNEGKDQGSNDNVFLSVFIFCIYSKKLELNPKLRWRTPHYFALFLLPIFWEFLQINVMFSINPYMEVYKIARSVASINYHRQSLPEPSEITSNRIWSLMSTIFIVKVFFIFTVN